MLRLSGERSARIGVAATVFVVAVAAGDLTLHPLIRLRAATIVMLLVGAAALWSARHAAWRRPVPCSLLLFALVAGLSTPLALVRAPDAGDGRAEVQGLLSGIAVALAVAALSRGTGAGLRAVRRGWAIALALSVGVAAMELLTGTHLWVGPGLAWAEQSRTIVAGAFRNPNDFAGVLVAMISGTLALLAAERHTPRTRALLVLLVCLGGITVTLTESRSGLVTLIAVLALHAVVLRRGVRLDRRVVVALAGLFVVGLAAAFLVPALAARNPLVRLLQSAAEPGTARSDRLRIDLVRAALRYVDGSDGLGTGAASFEPLLAADPNPGVATHTWLHNTFVEILLQYGVLPAGVLVAVLAGVTCAAVVARPVSPAVRVARAETLSAVVVFVALACASATVLTTPVWWLVLGQAVTSAWWLGSSEELAGSPDS